MTCNKTTTKILIGTTGSVASIKLPVLVKSLLEFENVELKIISTDRALHFFDKEAIKKDYGIQVITDEDEWKYRNWADVFLIAPLDANTLAKIANGLCDNLLTCILRAWELGKPVIVCPAMNTHMWNNQFTAQHLSILKKQLNFDIIQPISKTLACGDTGRRGMLNRYLISPYIKTPTLNLFETFKQNKKIFKQKIFYSQFSALSSNGEVPIRTHTCGELRIVNVGQHVVLNGWAQKIQNENLSNNKKPDLLEKLSNLSIESVISIQGMVMGRPKETINKNMETGEIEVEINELVCLNPAIKLPFFVSDKSPNEEVRFKHRFVDLRSELLQKNLRKRSLTSSIIRDFLKSEGFLEVETPILFKSTPEGAREFIVPTRTKGSFYALTQSPQQYKQLLMAGGIDKYFQFAKCFRDEDLRTDRQPEFTQIDLEISFISMSGIKSLIEKLLVKIWKDALNIDLNPFPTISYEKAMSKYGSDKPDTRYEMEIKNISQYLSDILENSSEIIECLVIKKSDNSILSQIKHLISSHNDPEIKLSSDNIDLLKITPKNIDSWLSKSKIIQKSSLIKSSQDILTNVLNVEVGDLIVLNIRNKFSSGSWTPLGRIRVIAAKLLQSKGLMKIDSSQYNFLWVDSFPLFTDGDDTGRLISNHHPFTALMPEDIDLLDKNPEKVRGQHYDLVLNGVEIGGGSIRIHSPILQDKIFNDILKLNQEEKESFSHLIAALGSGCPPHGGIALGFDRLMAIICNTDSIRNVMAFPKTTSGNDLTVSNDNINEWFTTTTSFLLIKIF
nr:2690_t:CDS:10 [Entrophospora candida]